MATAAIGRERVFAEAAKPALGSLPEAESFDPFEGFEAEIDAEFRRRLAGLKRLPPAERTAALMAARNWRAAASRELAERRGGVRAARWMRRIWHAAPAASSRQGGQRWP